MYWWLWLVAGLVLLGLEVLTPGGFYVLFFGIGALVVGTLVGLGAAGPVWFQWLLFSAISAGRRFLSRSTTAGRPAREPPRRTARRPPAATRPRRCSS